MRSIPGTGEMRVLGSKNELQAVSIKDDPAFMQMNGRIS